MSRAGRSARELAAAFGVADHRLLPRDRRAGTPLRDGARRRGRRSRRDHGRARRARRGLPQWRHAALASARMPSPWPAQWRNSPTTEMRANRSCRSSPAGAMIGAFAATEAKAGSDVMAMETRYAETRSGYVLNGEKAWISNATQADVFVVFATKDARLHSRGISAFLVERATPGVTIDGSRRARANGGSRSARVTLTDVHVGRESLIGRGRMPARRSSGTRSMQERILLSAFLVGSIRRALTRSIEHAKSRQQFGVPIASNQYVSGRIVDIYRATPRPGCCSSTRSRRLAARHRHRGRREPRQAPALGGRASRATSTPSASMAPRASRRQGMRGADRRAVQPHLFGHVGPAEGDHRRLARAAVMSVRHLAAYLL